MARNLTLTSATYDTTTPILGTASLNGGYGSGQTGLTAIGYTVECRIKGTTRPSASTAILAFNSGQANVYFNGYLGTNSSGNLLLQIQPNAAGGAVVNTAAVTNNVYDGSAHHVAFTVTASAITLYIDGVSVATSAGTYSAYPSIMSVRAGSDGTSLWPNEVDEVVVWPTVKYTGTFTPASSAYAGTEGMNVLLHLDSNGNDSSVTPATAYTLTGPSSGVVSVASSNFTVTPNGTLSASDTITPADGGAGGTFTPSTVIFASGSSAAQTFTYTPSSTVGTKTISTTNSGSLTNPASVSYNATLPPVTLGVTSAAVKFSPGNWQGDTGRGGTVYRQAVNQGAWFSYTWNASASPTAMLLLPASGTTSLITVFVNDVPYPHVAANANYTLSGLNPSSVNTVKVWMEWAKGTRWSNGSASIQVSGLQVDAASSAGTAPVSTSWGILGGDSITDGLYANAGTTEALYGYGCLTAQALATQGIDLCISSFLSTGWITPGGQTTEVPALYYISGSSGGSGGTYTDSSSRWNKIDAGVSILDSNGHYSAYGSTGTEPAFVIQNLMTNDAAQSKNVSDSQASVTQWMVAARGAAPNALIGLIVPFTSYASIGYASQSQQAPYLAALKAGFAAYQAAYPADTNIVLIDVGAHISTTVAAPAGGYIWTGDTSHLLGQGHSLVAPLVYNALMKALTPVTYPGGFHR